TLIRTLVVPAAFLFTLTLSAQVVSEAPQKTIHTAKAEVVSLAISPKGDRLLVGLNKGAELYDLESGKRIYAFPYAEDGGTTVYHVGFNENGEYALLIGFSGKRTVWDLKTGKQEKVLTTHNWIPDPRAVKAMGLDMSNSNFDRFYQQDEVVHDGVTVRAAKNGAVEFVDAAGKVERTITFPENKDQHHRAPLLFHDGNLLVGTDNGLVLFYPVL
ncbi:MAG TPA: hypothetical protein VKG92_04935, partial [Flavobacteriales bacterium]|nr:hypothetical protein [Flavobacteriales bacterium]